MGSSKADIAVSYDVSNEFFRLWLDERMNYTCGVFDTEETTLEQAQLNGVEGVEIIDAGAARALEPEFACVAALRSPETGIIDSHRFNAGAPWRSRGPRRGSGVQHADRARAAGAWGMGGLLRREQSAVGVFRRVVNCAGLGAQRLARATQDYPPERVPRLVLAKGNYFGFLGRPVFSRLIYPVPVPGGLGVHVTLDLAGRMRFGPDVEWIEEENYDVTPARAAAFYKGIRAYWPKLPDNSLAPDYAGMRPKLTGAGEPAADFMVQGPQHHGLERTVHMFGIESPGLTCALSLAEEVADYLSS